jgi:hypothetical protein
MPLQNNQVVRPRGRPRKSQRSPEESGDQSMKAGTGSESGELVFGSIGRTRRLIHAALRVWELKQGLG